MFEQLICMLKVAEGRRKSWAKDILIFLIGSSRALISAVLSIIWIALSLPQPRLPGHIGN